MDEQIVQIRIVAAGRDVKESHVCWEARGRDRERERPCCFVLLEILVEKSVINNLGTTTSVTE
jgi:hypothetical protein